ncbi:predicted protein [Nematostella vectensis]|uniref:DUF4604 domain-containing protein n=1 Tax=Nematostella vectensis TaxID=45351 RepID=A7S707_NEMVE|nr:predicted protein [Nematostella vectensis]|eukprot:XP_001632583.1 predicted protein [Nematostella vectensis]
MAGRNISYTKQATPAFIQQFKERVGYKEPDNVDSKRAEAEKSQKEDEVDREGEQPVVVLGKNVSEAEAESFLASQLENESQVEVLTRSHYIAINMTKPIFMGRDFFCLWFLL